MAHGVLRATVTAADGERNAVCPECGALLRDRREHLTTSHGYLEAGELLLPRDEALRRLWNKVFSLGDLAAHERLTTLLGEGVAGEPAYREALESELVRRADALFAERWQELPRLVHCLRQNKAARPAFRDLIRSRDPRVREMGRELVLPDVCKRLAAEDTSRARVRRWLDRLCPLDGMAERARLCQQLAQHGAHGRAVAACLEDLTN